LEGKDKAFVQEYSYQTAALVGEYVLMKTILVPLAGGDGEIAAMKAAFTIARRFDAHVAALFVRLDPRDAVPLLGEGMSGPMVDEIMRAAEAETNSRHAIARRHFDAAVAAASATLADTPPGPGGVTAEWREVEGRAEEMVPLESRFADMMVIGGAGSPADAYATTVLENALLGSGRPLLLVPPRLPETIGRHIALAWNASVEAARAVAGAVDLLRAAETVDVLVVETAVASGAAGRRISDYLAWHGVKVRLTIITSGPDPVGQVLMTKAAELGSDLVVMGGYGHSRMREMILGGVTRHVLHHAGLPVLMAH
jgi:nucleotide-binding universal stress UspA family protein